MKSRKFVTLLLLAAALCHAGASDTGASASTAAATAPLDLAGSLLYRVESRTDRQNELAFKLFGILLREGRLEEATALASKMTDHHRGMSLARLAVLRKTRGEQAAALELAEKALEETSTSRAIRRSGEVKAELMALDFVADEDEFSGILKQIGQIEDRRGKVAANAGYVRFGEIEDHAEFVAIIQQMMPTDPDNPRTEYDILSQAILDRAHALADPESGDDESGDRAVELAELAIEVGHRSKFVHPETLIRSAELAAKLDREILIDYETSGEPQRLTPVTMRFFMGIGDNNYWKAEKLVRLAVPAKRAGNEKLARELVENAEEVAEKTREYERSAAMSWATAGYAMLGDAAKASACGSKIIEMVADNPNPFNKVLAAMETCFAYHHFGLDLQPQLAENLRQLVLDETGTDA